MREYILSRIVLVATLMIAGLELFASEENGNLLSTEVSDNGNSFIVDSVMIPYNQWENRENIVFSLSTVKGDDLRSLNTPTLGNTLFGKLSGLYVSQTGGMSGDNDHPNLLIRGRGTFGDNSILVLVDGFETKWSNIMVDEIETIAVLKDAASLAVFGQKGANGVVLITTKRGASSKPQITLNSRFGIQSPTVMPRFLNNGDYAELYNVAMGSDGKDIESGYFYHPQIDVVDAFKSQAYPYLYPDVDWYNEVLSSSATSQDYNVSIKGGNVYAKYFVSVGYADYQGLYKNTDSRKMINSNYQLQRYNVRTNVDVVLNNFLSAQVGLRGTVDDKFYPNVGQNELWKSMAVFNPYPIQTPEGKWGGMQEYSANPVASVLGQGYNKANERTVDANVKLIANLNSITRGLEAFGQVAFGNNYYSTYRKNRSFSFDELSPRPDLIVPGVTPEGEMPYDRTTIGDTDANFSIAHTSGTQWNRITFLSGVNFSRELGKSGLAANALYRQDKYNAKGFDPAMANQEIIGRISFNYDKKYLLDLSGSYSGSESFPKGKRFGLFPALGAGWVISREDFFNDFTLIDLLKIRGSVGLTGNQSPGSARFLYNQYYVGAGSYLLGDNLSQNHAMFREGNLANLNATWEKSLKSNVGIDLVVNKVLSVSADYFYDKRSDILVNPNNYIPAMVGANFHDVNRGKVNSKGFEVELLYQNNFGALGYFVGGNFSHSKTKIIDMAEPVLENEYRYAKGNSVGQPFVLEAIGFFNDEDDIASSPLQLFGAVQAGDIKYKDQNNDGFIDDNDLIPVGKTRDPELMYAINAGLNFKGFDLNVFFQGVSGRTVSLLQNDNVIPFLNGGVKPVQWIKENYWTSERGDAAKFPRLTTEPNSNNYRPSTLWQRDGSFLRLKNLEIGYTLTSRIMNRFNIDHLRFYVNGVNLWSKDHIDEIDVDPEVMNMFAYPSMKSINFGLTLNL